MKFKPQLAFALCTLYIFSVMGIALSMHFCGGKLADVAFYTNKTVCKFCKTAIVDQKDDGCCKNTKVDVKVKDSHQAEAAFKLPKLFSTAALLPANVRYEFRRVLPVFIGKITNKAPPKLSSVALHVLNCVFRN